MADDKSIGSTTQSIAVSALRAQQARMRIIAENLANANSPPAPPAATPIAGRRRCSAPPRWPVAASG